MNDDDDDDNSITSGPYSFYTCQQNWTCYLRSVNLWLTSSSTADNFVDVSCLALTSPCSVSFSCASFSFRRFLYLVNAALCLLQQQIILVAAFYTFLNEGKSRWDQTKVCICNCINWLKKDKNAITQFKVIKCVYYRHTQLIKCWYINCIIP